MVQWKLSTSKHQNMIMEPSHGFRDGYMIPTSIGDRWNLRWEVLPKFIVRLDGNTRIPITQPHMYINKLAAVIVMAAGWFKQTK